MRWSKNPLYAKELQIFVNWATGYDKYRPENWHANVKSYQYHERSFKSQLCLEFAKVFGALPPYSVDQLRDKTLGLLTLRSIDVRKDFSFLHTTEIARLNQWLRDEDDETLWNAFSVLYSSASDDERFSHFVDTIEEFLERQHSPSRVSPPMLTFWLAYHDPESEVFFKPQSTTDFYQRYGRSAPSDSVVVKRYLRFRQDASEILFDLHSVGMDDANMIDVQSCYGPQYLNGEWSD